MGKVKLSVRLATFLVTFTLALAIVTLFAQSLISDVNVPPVAGLALTPPKLSFVSDQGSNFVDYKTQLVSLDFVRGKAYVTLALERRAGETAPDKIWIQTIFFAPDVATRKVWTSAPVEISEPFALGATRTLTVAAACLPCANEDAPANNYYARTFVSTTAANLTPADQTNFDFDIADAAPVLVQNKPAAATSLRP